MTGHFQLVFYIIIQCMKTKAHKFCVFISLLHLPHLHSPHPPCTLLISSPPSWPPWYPYEAPLLAYISSGYQAESKAGSSHDWWANGILIQLLNHRPVAISACQPFLFGNLLYWELWRTWTHIFTQLAALLHWWSVVSPLLTCLYNCNSA